MDDGRTGVAAVATAEEVTTSGSGAHAERVRTAAVTPAASVRCGPAPRLTPGGVRLAEWR
ncbi:hypothetical protein Sm713_33320 [Streptomyces sp. TS71-3]|nr:hypothetical protein Sm713_33320 [Streptomyces sp. TS71-3]